MHVALLIVQIIAESLPISSSSHVKLISLITQTELPDWLNYILHLPTIIIAVTWVMLWQYFQQGIVWNDILQVCIYASCANVITIGCYVLFKIFRLQLPLPIGLIISAALLLHIALYSRNLLINSIASLSFLQWCMLATVQGICLQPGISRLAGTMYAGLMMGCSPRVAFIASWVLAIPLMTGALVYSAVTHISELRFYSSFFAIPLIIASIGAFIMFSFSYFLLVNQLTITLSLYMICLAVVAYIVAI